MRKIYCLCLAFGLVVAVAFAAASIADDGAIVATSLSYTADQTYFVTLTCTRKSVKAMLFWIRLMTGLEVPHGSDKCYWTIDALRGSVINLLSRAETIDFLSHATPPGYAVTDLLTNTPVALLEDHGDLAFKRAFDGAVVISAAKARVNILD